MRILQINLHDQAGGAEKVALELHDNFRRRGHTARFAVGRKHTSDRDVFEIPRPPWHEYWNSVTARLIGAHVGLLPRATRFLATLGNLGNWIDERRGNEPFHFSGSRRVLALGGGNYDIVHAHNLHGGYFDLRILPQLSSAQPLFITLHDAWLLSGHCAHSFDCERWKTGCGECPDLTIYPAIRRDATAENFSRKQSIYRQSRLHIATPSQWLMDKVDRSMLACSAVEHRVIPNGVDLSIFAPGDRREARAALGIPADARVLLTTAFIVRDNIWKDYRTLREAFGQVASQPREGELILVALGENGPPERFGNAEIRFVPFEREPALVARYYRAADLYVHAARADTFPNTVLEALASGTPTVATAVGGIPEQIENGATGFLVPPQDPRALAEAISALLNDPDKRKAMGAAARISAEQRFSVERMVDRYLNWYAEILAKRQSGEASGDADPEPMAIRRGPSTSLRFAQDDVIGKHATQRT